MKIDELVQNWISDTGRSVQTVSSLSRCGYQLFSYAELIAVKFEGIVYITDRKFSMTTTRQTNKARNAAIANGFPVKTLNDFYELDKQRVKERFIKISAKLDALHSGAKTS